jgi:hypothetical protein
MGLRVCSIGVALLRQQATGQVQGQIRQGQIDKREIDNRSTAPQ